MRDPVSQHRAGGLGCNDGDRHVVAAVVGEPLRVAGDAFGRRDGTGAKRGARLIVEAGEILVREGRPVRRLIDWLIALPAEQERLVDREIEKIEEEHRMAYVTSWERIGEERGRVEGLLQGLAIALDLKFGAAGTALLPELEQISDPEVLRRVAERIKTSASVDELRQVYRPGDQL